MKTKFSPFSQAITLGVLAGMRSMFGPVIVSHYLSRHHSGKLKGSPLNFMQSIKTDHIFKILAAGELIMDKLPFTPNRTKPAVAIGRLATAAVSGATVYKANGKEMANGAVVGATAALAATFASFYLRRTITEKTKIFDPIIGAIEDAIVIYAGTRLIKTIPDYKKGKTVQVSAKLK